MLENGLAFLIDGGEDDTSGAILGGGGQFIYLGPQVGNRCFLDLGHS